MLFLSSSSSTSFPFSFISKGRQLFGGKKASVVVVVAVAVVVVVAVAVAVAAIFIKLCPFSQQPLLGRARFESISIHSRAH